MAANIGLTYFYANNYLTVDEDKYETQELYTEGLMNSFGIFGKFEIKVCLKKKIAGLDLRIYVFSLINDRNFIKQANKLGFYLNIVFLFKPKQKSFIYLTNMKFISNPKLLLISIFLISILF